MELEPRDTQTQIKHMILAKYMDTWGGIVFNALRSTAQRVQRHKKFDLHFVYMDCFAYKGRYSGNRQDILLNYPPQDVFGSPIIGIRALDKLADFAQKEARIDLRINAVLVEREAEHFDVLLESLSLAKLGHRVRRTLDFSRLLPGEIAVVHGDSIALEESLLAYTKEDYTWAFYLLDPYGPSGIPHDFVRAIVQQDRHDVMINFPYQDLHRKTGFILSDKLEPKHQQLIEYWTAVFGSEEWKKIAPVVASRRTSRDALWDIPLEEEELSPKSDQLSTVAERQRVNLYRNVLRKMDPSLAVKLVDLQFPAKERTMFYLFLTTHDPTGALSLNRILADAKLWEYELRYRYRFAKKTAAPPGQPPLFTVEPNVPKPEAPSRPPVERIAEEIMRVFVGRAVSRRDVYHQLADEMYFPDEIDKALRLLRKTKRANFAETLSHKTLIRFSTLT